MKLVAVIAVLFTLMGCSPSQTDIDEAALRIQRLSNCCKNIATSLDAQFEFRYEIGKPEESQCELFYKDRRVTSFPGSSLYYLDNYLQVKANIKSKPQILHGVKLKPNVVTIEVVK